MSMEPTPPAESSGAAKRYVWLGALIAGYIGIYLCRKNLSVAVPLLQEAFHASKAEVGAIASASTIAYAVGKFTLAPLVDRIGGRAGMLSAMLIVCVMGALGGFAPSLAMLSVLYSINRFAGAGGWPSMVKLTPQWFSARQAPFAMALLSLSFVVGGACATFFAGWIVSWSGKNWRVVMAVPSIVLLLCVVFCALILPREERAAKQPSGSQKPKAKFNWQDVFSLFASAQFWIVCSLSFVLTLLRETCNTWMPDFVKTQGGLAVSVQKASFISTAFDILGIVGILSVGWLFGRLALRGKKIMLSGILAVLAVTLFFLPGLFKIGLTPVTLAIGAVGFLTYGPYSLLAGALSLEVGGKRRVATVSGMVDGCGYLAGILAGERFGHTVDVYGYPTGFKILAFLAILSGALSLLLRERTEPETA